VVSNFEKKESIIAKIESTPKILKNAGKFQKYQSMIATNKTKLKIKNKTPYQK